MISRERIFAVMAGKEVDRRPFTAFLALYGARLTGCPLKEYYGNEAAYSEGQAAVFEEFHPDILFSPMAIAIEGEIYGSEVRYFENQAPNLLKPAVLTVKDLENLTQPDVDSHPRLLFIRRSVQRIVSSFGREVAVAAIILSPVDSPVMILGLERWLDTVLFDREGTKRVLDVTIPFFIRWANSLFADGADMLILPSALLNPTIVTREIVERTVLPVLKRAFSMVQVPIVIHHTGARFCSFLDLYADLPNVAGVVLDHRDDFITARGKVGDKMVLIGGIDGPSLRRSSPKAITDHCKSILEKLRTDRRYILATSAADVAYDTPKECIHAVKRATEE